VCSTATDSGADIVIEYRPRGRRAVDARAGSDRRPVGAAPRAAASVADSAAGVEQHRCVSAAALIRAAFRAALPPWSAPRQCGRLAAFSAGRTRRGSRRAAPQLADGGRARALQLSAHDALVVTWRFDRGHASCSTDTRAHCNVPAAPLRQSSSSIGVQPSARARAMAAPWMRWWRSARSGGSRLTRWPYGSHAVCTRS